MANPDYDPGDDQSQRIGQLFEGIASRYDLINDLQSLGFHRGWKRRLVKLCRLTSTDVALDICCGTGDISWSLAQAGARTVGLDSSPNMLRLASQRTAAGPYVPVFIQGDAMRMPFLDACFDVVTISYGLRNLPRVEAALKEIRRLVKPGGRLLILDFGKPPNPLWRGIYFAYLRWVVPVIGRIFCGNAQAYSYILESLQRYGAQTGVTGALKASHWVNILVVNCLGGAMSIHYAEKPLRN
jgi:demethylmenaquinone methyltransferase / 2-methoxy-6-polyprenyl-1,4-benzoquinol methylase